MSLPLPVIDRLFARLNATYGRDFMSRYEGQDSAAVKTSWSHELDGYQSNLKPLAWALENLPERCPNVIEFRTLCRRAPADEVPLLAEPKADPARVAAELEKLGHIKVKSSTAQNGMKDWAHRLKSRHDAGQKLNMNQVRCYREALGLNEPAMEAA
ncbi:MAG: hypothetical protein HHJ15_16685 [Rhodoferax sp.]|uniref:hypothetical protein n=1 Tax=Rhodoferax sp. TaxID=50421 RepID=UPI0017B8077A|nr:hypothetical protein [Rhodoferax sp.]NMM21564.1 hypothetical protein [Rhodoferax sp.]